MDDLTIVFVYNDKKAAFVATPACNVVCPECGNRRQAGNMTADDDIWWEEVNPGEPFLQCDCGEQFYTRED